MGFLIRGRIPSEESNPLNRWLVRLYRPVLERVLVWPRATLGIALLLLGLTIIPVLKLGGEFMPPLDEGDHSAHAIGTAGPLDRQSIAAFCSRWIEC
jgi:Cu(I)/Ag(I) efflux system membrane protein CusA/SilA